MEAIAKHTFEGNGTDELNFYKGCVLKVSFRFYIENLTPTIC